MNNRDVSTGDGSQVLILSFRSIIQGRARHFANLYRKVPGIFHYVLIHYSTGGGKSRDCRIAALNCLFQDAILSLRDIRLANNDLKRTMPFLGTLCLLH